MIQLLFELYSLQQRWISDDDKMLEERVKREIGICPSGELSLADTIRCQQQYRLPLINGWSDNFASRVRDYAWRTFMSR